MTDVISKQEISQLLEISPHLPVYVFDEIDSTNHFAKTLSEDFALVVANSQSMGRGRLNRSFHSPRGSGIYLSFKTKVPDLYHNVPFVTTLSAVAVHKAVKKLFNINCGIKWVNDIYIGTKKLSGILCEIVDDAHAVIGIGLNFYPSPMPDELKHKATHLTDYASGITRNMLIGEIVSALSELIKNLPDTSFIEYYKAHSIVIGKSILCIQGENSFKATAVDIDSSGALVVKTPEGLRTLSTGEITLRFTD